MTENEYTENEYRRNIRTAARLVCDNIFFLILWNTAWTCFVLFMQVKYKFLVPPLLFYFLILLSFLCLFVSMSSNVLQQDFFTGPFSQNIDMAGVSAVAAFLPMPVWDIAVIIFLIVHWGTTPSGFLKFAGVLLTLSVLSVMTYLAFRRELALLSKTAHEVKAVMQEDVLTINKFLDRTGTGTCFFKGNDIAFLDQDGNIAVFDDAVRFSGRLYYREGTGGDSITKDDLCNNLDKSLKLLLKENEV